MTNSRPSWRRSPLIALAEAAELLGVSKAVPCERGRGPLSERAQGEVDQAQARGLSSLSSVEERSREAERPASMRSRERPREGREQ